MLKQRVMTALMLAVPMLAILFWLPKMLTVLVFAALTLLGAWEWTSFLRLQQRASRYAYVTLIALVMWSMWHFITTLGQLQALLWATVAWWSVALVWLVFMPQRQSRLLAFVGGLLVLAPAWLCLSQLQRQDSGAQWVLFLLVLVVAMDVGGYFVGGRFGKRKLAPMVSPGKSWEGLWGGLALSLLVALVGAIGFAVPATSFMLLCLVTAVTSVVGDLTESLFKRHAGLKDSGNVLPGHGGILDRMDSITAAAPVFLGGLIYLGVFPV
jgi:phosphatidate cytidylyltransferase